MKKDDISNHFFEIQEVISAFSSQMKQAKAWTVDGRASDAFIYVTTGACAYTFLNDGYGFTVRAGDVLYLAEGAVYRMEITNEPYGVVYCNFRFRADRPLASAVYHLSHLPNVEETLRRLLPLGSTDAARAEALSVLYRIYGAILHTSEEEYLAPTARDKMQKIKEFIDAHFAGSDLTVASLAAVAQMSEAYLRRLFRAQYGISPSQYITQARLSHAKQLLSYPFLSMEDIARQSGFLDAPYFCRVFKSRHGLTPSQYRRNHAKP